MTARSDDARILVVTLSNIGDLVMTTPVLETLATKFPDTPLDIVADQRSSSLLQAAPYIGTIYHRDKGAPWADQWRLLRRLRRRRYDLVVDLRTVVIPWLVRADRRVAKRSRRNLARHAVEEHFSALGAITGSAVPPPCRVYLPESAVRKADELLSPLPGSRWLAIAPGANWPGKRWPQSSYRALLQQCRQAFDGAIIVGGRGDLEHPFSSSGVDLPVVDLYERTDLVTAAAVLARAGAVVGNDSGLGHIAAALGVPTLTVFGPGQPRRYRPWGARTRVVSAPEADLTLLKAETVTAALLEFLSASPPTASGAPADS